MAELSPALRTGAQLRAIAAVRWQLMANGVRTTRGALELVARVWVGFWFAVVGFGAGVGFGVAAWYFAGQSKLEWLAVLLWPLFLFWQVFPLATSAFTEQTDTSHLLRYPLRFPAFVLVRVVFGAFDAATLVGLLCLLGMVVGLTVAQPLLLPAAVLAALLLAAFNILLAQMIFAWLERWLARRRTREILMVLFLLLAFSANFIGPLTRSWHLRGSAVSGEMAWLLPVERWLPPGLGAHALAAAAAGHAALAGVGLLLLAAWSVPVLLLYDLRLRAEFRGETLVEGSAAAPAARATRAPATAGGMALPGVAGPVGAVAFKELRYLARSPMMFFSLAMPVALLVLFRLQVFSGPRAGGRAHAPFNLALFGFPIGVAYALLVLSNLVFNAFGTDAVGVQFYFVAPVRFRQILMGKNLAYALILAAEAVVILLAAMLMGAMPPAWVVAATLLGLVFGACCDFACGNLLSLYMPKKIDLSRLGRQGGRGTSGMVALALQGVVVGLCAIAVFGGLVLHRVWLAVLILALLAIAAALAYFAVLNLAEPIAQSRRETLIAELSKA